jgi:predicted AAA+ superfamily ATPase
VKTYLEKDVRDLLNIKDIMQFLRFMKLCAARIGSIFNASELSGEVGVDSKTIASWLSVLQASYIIYLLPPYYENISKRLVKSPKLYFCDPGLACYLLDIESPRQLNRDKMRGNIFENFVVMEAVKHRMNAGKDGGVFFYRDSNKNEVDLLVKEEGEITALEIKSSQTYSKSFADTLERLPGWIKTPVRKRAVVYAGDFENNAGKIDIINYKHLEI